MPEAALAQAKAVDEEIARGNSISTLAGIPLALKDLLCTQGAATTCSSRILRNFIPPYDATVVRRLKEEKASSWARPTWMSSPWALPPRTQVSSPPGIPGVWIACPEDPVEDRRRRWPQARRLPRWDRIRGLHSPACLPLRGDRHEAHLWQGLPFRAGGLRLFIRSDRPFQARMWKTVAVLLNAICGHDPQDSTSVNMAVPDFTRSLLPEVRGFRLGVPAEYFVEGMDPGVKAPIEKAIGALEELGAGCEEVSLPHTEYAVAVYYLVATAEASSNLARYDGVKYGYRSPRPGDLLDMYSSTRAEGFGAEVKRRIMLGTYALSSGYYDAYYLKAQKVRTLIRRISIRPSSVLMS